MSLSRFSIPTTRRTPDFLDKVLGYFENPGVAFVQGPQVFYNRFGQLDRARRGGAKLFFLRADPDGIVRHRRMRGQRQPFHFSRQRSVRAQGRRLCRA